MTEKLFLFSPNRKGKLDYEEFLFLSIPVAIFSNPEVK